MYIKKVDGPRFVTLPDGSILTRADLPPPDTVRWVAGRKARVVRAVIHGLISREDVLIRYGLTEEEFANWESSEKLHGAAGLRVTKLQSYRQF